MSDIFLELFAAGGVCFAALNAFGALSKATGWREANWGPDGWPNTTSETLMLVAAYCIVSALLHLMLLRGGATSMLVAVNAAAMLLSFGVAVAGDYPWLHVVIAAGATALATSFARPKSA